MNICCYPLAGYTGAPQNTRSTVPFRDRHVYVRAAARLIWVQLYAEVGDAGLVCRRCGISRPTLRKWWRRFRAEGEVGLRSHSRRPKHTREPKLTPEIEGWVMDLRRSRNLGPKRIRAELLRLHQCSLSTRTIWQVLTRHGASPILRQRTPTLPARYSRPVPGDRVQLDTMQIRRGLFQFTAVDDCSRMRVLGLYARRTAKNAVHFLEERVLEEFPFPVQRIQADRGAEFFGMVFQRALRRHKIKFRPIPPRSPHLNGKVERSQQTDWIEFYATVDLTDPALEEQLGDWQQFYNFQRSHSALSGKTPVQHCCERYPQTPWNWEVAAQYDASSEPFRERQYHWDQRIAKVKRSM